MAYDLTSIDDQELLLLLKEEERAAFTETYNRYSGSLYVYVYKRLKNREEAKDLIHELFLELWANCKNINPNTVLPAYLYMVARNKIINLISRQKVATRYIDSFQFYLDKNYTDNTDHLVRHNEMQAFIAAEIASLPPKIQMVFELSRKTNLTRKEIAEKLNVSEETVKSQMHSALKTLKVKLGSHFPLIF